MSESEDEKQKPLVAPQEPPADRVRTVVSAVAQLAPAGGFLTALVDDIIPTGAERERRVWEGAISKRTNEHSERLADHQALLRPEEKLQGVTATVAVALANDCPNGLGRKQYELKALGELCPGITSEDLADAIYELKALDLVHMTAFVGGHWYATLAERFYEQIDHQVMGWSTSADAVEIAKLILEHNIGRASQLHELTGWTARRFNPALRQVLDIFPPGRVSRERQPHYVSSYVAMISEDRVALRRFIKSRSAT